MTTRRSPRHRAADMLALKLATEVSQALHNGQRIPCAGRPEWLAEDQESINYAEFQCRSCPLLEQCAATASALKPTAGVWAGELRSDCRRPITRTTTKKESV